MSKFRKKTDEKQLSIFDLLRSVEEARAVESNEEGPPGGQFKIIDELRESLRNAIKKCPLSVHQIAGEMSHHLGETITREVIYSWTRSSDELNGRPTRHIPAEYIPGFCHVTGSNEPLIIMGRLVGLFVLPGPEALRAEIHKLDEDIQKAKARKRKRMLFLKEMEKKI